LSVNGDSFSRGTEMARENVKLPRGRARRERAAVFHKYGKYLNRFREA
jgi:hypothetical protein